MTNFDETPIADTAAETSSELEESEEKRRRLLLLLILLLLLLCCLFGFLGSRYLANPVPLPDIISVTNINYPPHFAYSIYKLDQPVAVAISPDGTKIYAAESGGARKIKIFSRKGDLLGSFGPPHLKVGEIGYSYMAVNKDGRLFVADRIQGVVYIFDADGKYLDSLLTPTLTLRGFIAQQNNGDVPDGSRYMYSFLGHSVVYTLPGQDEKLVDLNTGEKWAPMGVRFDHNGNLLVTDALKETHQVRIFDAALINSPDYWKNFAPRTAFGTRGSENAQFLYPNAAVTDGRSRFFVSDGNNGRISMWDPSGKFLVHFGVGVGPYSLNLPRGIWVDQKDRLHIVDAVAQDVKVYDVSVDEPAYLYSFGDFGIEDGYFNFPNDIAMDRSGWLFIADRENNRIQVWSY